MSYKMSKNVSFTEAYRGSKIRCAVVTKEITSIAKGKKTIAFKSKLANRRRWLVEAPKALNLPGVYGGYLRCADYKEAIRIYRLLEAAGLVTA